MVFLANLVFNFHSGFYISTTFLLVNVYLMQNMKNTSILFFFSQHWTYFGPNFVPRTTPTLLFLADFQRNMLGDTININNLCCNPSSSEKKLFKTPKNCFFGPNLHRKGLIMGHAQGGIFFSRKKADHQLSESFYFIKISHFD